jgi:hypothetical protein
MHRELYNLLYSENKELPCPLIPTDSSKGIVILLSLGCGVSVNTI